MSETPTVVSHVMASIGGKALRFEIPRTHAALGRLELDVGSALEVWRRLTGEKWTAADVLAVLRASHPALPDRHQPPMPLRRLDGSLADAVVRTQGVDPHVVEALVQRQPMAMWAALAGLVMTAFIFGLDDDKAVFSVPS
ncbi:MAG: hypothetical protein K2X71_21400 [Methylobacterium sp.]|uniref:hypothetical protein n=1 Tax=Methylobacterium sp. TaxID=409 RepID=UPI00258535D4|nr:hypothetical protein [Methylobacterium sp.]MBY0298561.1 hypothetical protein [Methylobacterium sp.]